MSRWVSRKDRRELNQRSARRSVVAWVGQEGTCGVDRDGEEESRRVGTTTKEEKTKNKKMTTTKEGSNWFWGKKQNPKKRVEN